jgi:hypothetical protein
VEPAGPLEVVEREHERTVAREARELVADSSHNAPFRGLVREDAVTRRGRLFEERRDTS